MWTLTWLRRPIPREEERAEVQNGRQEFTRLTAACVKLYWSHPVHSRRIPIEKPQPIRSGQRYIPAFYPSRRRPGLLEGRSAALFGAIFREASGNFHGARRLHQSERHAALRPE